MASTARECEERGGAAQEAVEEAERKERRIAQLRREKDEAMAQLTHARTQLKEVGGGRCCCRCCCCVCVSLSLPVSVSVSVPVSLLCTA